MTHAAAGGGPPKNRVLAVVASIGPPATVISSVLVFFGWIKAESEAKAMGLNVNLFGYAPQDYVRISMMHLAVPLVCLFAVALGWLGLDRRLCRRLDRPGTRPGVRHAAEAGFVISVLMAGGALLLAALRPGPGTLYAPYVVAAGVLLAAWAHRLRRHAQAEQGPPPSIQRRAGEGALVFGLVAVLMLWGAGNHAQAVGRRTAAELGQHVNELPEVALYSTARLAISAPNVTETKLGTGIAPLYRYDGLRLLTVSGGNLFFLHAGWTARHGTVVVLPADKSVRVEYGR